MITYNTEAKVRACLKSVFNERSHAVLAGESEDCIQVFVADGGSCDNTMEIVREFPIAASCSCPNGRANVSLTPFTHLSDPASLYCCTHRAQFCHGTSCLIPIRH